MTTGRWLDVEMESRRVGSLRPASTCRVMCRAWLRRSRQSARAASTAAATSAKPAPRSLSVM